MNKNHPPPSWKGLHARASGDSVSLLEWAARKGFASLQVSHLKKIATFVKCVWEPDADLDDNVLNLVQH
eukprot:6344418-Amphidinium_carterae.1